MKLLSTPLCVCVCVTTFTPVKLSWLCPTNSPSPKWRLTKHNCPRLSMKYVPATCGSNSELYIGCGPKINPVSCFTVQSHVFNCLPWCFLQPCGETGLMDSEMRSTGHQWGWAMIYKRMYLFLIEWTRNHFITFCLQDCPPKKILYHHQKWRSVIFFVNTFFPSW